MVRNVLNQRVVAKAKNRAQVPKKPNQVLRKATVPNHRLLAGPFATDIVCELELHSFDTVNNNVAASNATTAYSIVSSFFTYESGLWGPTSLCTTKNSFILVRNASIVVLLLLLVLQRVPLNMVSNVQKKKTTKKIKSIYIQQEYNTILFYRYLSILIILIILIF